MGTKDSLKGLPEHSRLLPLRFLWPWATHRAGLDKQPQVTSLQDLDDRSRALLETTLGYPIAVAPGRHGFGTSQGAAPSGMEKLVASDVCVAFTGERNSGICLFRVVNGAVQFDPQTTALPSRLADLVPGDGTACAWRRLPGCTCLAIDRFVRGNMYHEVCDHLLRAYRQQLDWEEGEGSDRRDHEHRIAFAGTAWSYSRYLIGQIIHHAVEFLEPEAIYQCEELIYFSNLARVKSPGCIRDPGYVDHLRKVILDRIELLPPKQPLQPVRLYINRLSSPNRKIQREPRLAAALEASGVRNVSMETLSPFDQIQLFHSASLIIAPHGAALTNLLFASPQCRVVELLPMPRTHYQVICESFNLSYWGVALDQLAHLGVHAIARDLLRMAGES